MGIEEEGQGWVRNSHPSTLSVPIPGRTHLFLLPMFKASSHSLPHSDMEIRESEGSLHQGGEWEDALTRFRRYGVKISTKIYVLPYPAVSKLTVIGGLCRRLKRSPRFSRFHGMESSGSIASMTPVVKTLRSDWVSGYASKSENVDGG